MGEGDEVCRREAGLTGGTFHDVVEAIGMSAMGGQSTLPPCGQST
jgi:hypothetical protein